MNNYLLSKTVSNEYKQLCKIFENLNITPLLGGNLSVDNFFKLYNKDVDNTVNKLNKNYKRLLTLLKDLNARIKYVSSGSTGHFFKCAILKGNCTSLSKENIKCKFALKMTPYLKRDDYNDIYELTRPENTELNMLKALSYFVLTEQTKHIILPIQSFYSSISDFTKMLIGGKINDPKKRYENFMTNYKNKKYDENVSVLILELASGGDLLSFLKKYYTHLQLIDWKILFFQLLSVLAIIQYKFSAFRHNDLKANNVLIHLEEEAVKRSYHINNKVYILPETIYVIKLCDFDFACIPGYVNNIKVTEKWTKNMNITINQNRYYDIHYFFNTLIHNGFFPEILNNKIVYKEVGDFIDRIIPNNYKNNLSFVNQKGRLMKDIEYTTPLIILENDIFFKEFRL